MVTAIITARKNSKGLIGKNVKELGGKPLIWHTLEIASKVSSFDQVILSTDIDLAISLASEFSNIEVPFKRPDALSTDTTSQLEVVNHVLDYLESDERLPAWFVLLQPTCPFRTVEEMEEGVSLLKSGALSVVGVSKVMHHPADYLVRNAEGKIEYLMPQYLSKRRQDFPEVYFNNGGFYGCQTAFFREEKVFYNSNSALLEMSEYSLVDIDNEFDFQLANALFTIK
jgi:CMP-N,N'-diacetyllegionaminic acid synthase